MKLSIDLPRIVADQLGRSPINIPVTIDVGMFLEYSELDESEIDIHELLRENRMIGHFYCIDDVLNLRPDLSFDQAWQIMQTMEKSLALTPESGLSWDGIRDAADSLFPSKTAYTGNVTVSIESDKVLSQEDAQNLYAEVASDINHRHRYVRAKYERESMRIVHVTSEGDQS